MKLKQKFKYWWFRQTRKMYLQAGGRITSLAILPFRPVRLEVDLQYEMDPRGCLRPRQDSVYSELARRIGQKMIEERLVEIQEYSQSADEAPFPFAFRFRCATVLKAYVLNPKNIDYVTPGFVESWDLFKK